MCDIIGFNRGYEMADKFLRVRIPDTLYLDFKLICVEKDLSLPKQTAALIKSFVEVQKENKKRMEGGK